MEAIAVYKDFQPDMVFMRISMPDSGGLATLKEIKKMDSYAKVVIVTAMNQQPLVMEALETEAMEFLTIPFDQEGFCATVKKALD